ncbi:MAG: acyltransferase, partial [Bacteroidales bacterium]|nr:acyltransferase [Bacteroidales bacterium]
MQQGENNTSSDFSKIEPYAEQNINDALKRILANPVFQVMIDYLFPQESHAKLRTDLSQATTSLEFQTLFMYTGLKSVLKKTTPKGLSFRGSEYVIDGKAKTYISNHRDILLDSALLQTILVDLGLETSEISFGDNLIVNDFINDFGRINRMFTVFREGPPREMLQNAKTLSAYINMTLKQKKRSIWIAQRKGRAKNGIDKTDLGVLKMLTSSSDDTLKEAVR